MGKSSVTWPKPRCWQGCFYSRGSSGEAIPRPFPASHGSWHALACGCITWVFHARIYKSPSALFTCSLLFMSNVPLLPSYKDISLRLEPTQIMQDKLISRPIIQSHLHRAVFPQIKSCYRIQRLGPNMFGAGGGHFLAFHGCHLTEIGDQAWGEYNEISFVPEF